MKIEEFSFNNHKQKTLNTLIMLEFYKPAS